MRVDETVTIQARPDCVWDHVRDPRAYAGWMRAVTRFDAVAGTSGAGVGSRYSMRIRAGSAEVGGVVELVEYEECKDVAWHSVSGIDQRGRLRLREPSRGCTAVTFRVSYQSPGGVWGLIADRVSGPEMRRNVRSSLEALRQLCEATPSGTAARSDPFAFLRSQAEAVRVLAEAGVLRPSRPDRFLGAAVCLYRWGLTLPGGFTAAAARYPDALSLIDERGDATFRTLDARTNAIAAGMRESGIGEGMRVGVLCRNHAGFVEAVVALTKLGADVLLLNTGFAGPQLRDVLQRERADAIVHDVEFARLLGDALPRRRRFIAWSDSGRATPRSLDGLARRGDEREPFPPEEPSRITVLTSGTTGTPKGASRGQPRSAEPIVGILSKIPLRARGTTLIATPLFHAWGLAQLGLAVVLSSTVVLQRRFDPEATLAAVEQHRVTALVAIPVMLRRILDLPEATRSRYDTSSLRVVAVSGSALPADLATRFMDEYGDILYNLYGSTEVAAAAIATPDDMRAAPGTVGRPPSGTVVQLLDNSGRDVAPGDTGRIFVGNDMLFEGYTSGDAGIAVNGLLSTGDTGLVDPQGRLFVVGRSDDMVVSGGENVFPAEVEELLVAHPDIEDAAVVGVPDEEWGGRLRAYVVRRRSRLSADDVKRHVRSRLARHKVPRDVEFVQAIPRSETGKVVKAELGAR